MDIEFQLVHQSEVGKPEFADWNVQACDAVKLAGIPLQPAIEPFLHINTEAGWQFFIHNSIHTIHTMV